MSRTRLVSVLFWSLAALAGATANAPPPEMAPVKAKPEEVPSTYKGIVVAVTDKTVTIKPSGDVTITKSRIGEGGKKEVVWVYTQDNTKPPQAFVFSDAALWANGTLPFANRAGKPALAVNSNSRLHKISDLCLGDLVEITCGDVGGTVYCNEIAIIRRPGGQVPPTIGDDTLPVADRVCTQRNAAQAREEQIVRHLSRLMSPFFP